MLLWGSRRSKPELVWISSVGRILFQHFPTQRWATLRCFDTPHCSRSSKGRGEISAGVIEARLHHTPGDTLTVEHCSNSRGARPRNCKSAGILPARRRRFILATRGSFSQEAKRTHHSQASRLATTVVAISNKSFVSHYDSSLLAITHTAIVIRNQRVIIHHNTVERRRNHGRSCLFADFSLVTVWARREWGAGRFRKRVFRQVLWEGGGKHLQVFKERVPGEDGVHEPSGEGLAGRERQRRTDCFECKDRKLALGLETDRKPVEEFKKQHDVIRATSWPIEAQRGWVEDYNKPIDSQVRGRLSRYRPSTGRTSEPALHLLHSFIPRPARHTFNTRDPLEQTQQAFGRCLPGSGIAFPSPEKQLVGSCPRPNWRTRRRSFPADGDA